MKRKIIVAVLLIISIGVAAHEAYAAVRSMNAEYPDNDISGSMTAG